MFAPGKPAIRFVAVLALLSPACGGERPASGTARAAVIGGTPDTTHPGVVAVLGKGAAGGVSWCSGVIVKTDVAAGIGYVVTSAGCLSALTDPLVVETEDLAGDVNDARPHPVLDFRPHPAWSPSSADDAIAFARILEVTEQTPFIPLLTPEDDHLASGDELRLVGFGRTSETYLEDDGTAKRQSATLVLGDVTPELLRSTEGEGRACLGDNGGALILEGQSAPRLAGTVLDWDKTCTYLTDAYRDSAAAALLEQFASESVPETCDTCFARSAKSGACAKATAACDADPQCFALKACVSACDDQACTKDCYTQAGASFVGFDDAVQCLCDDCSALCAGSCPTPYPSCDRTDGFDDYNLCLRSSCCDEITSCYEQASCWSCAGYLPDRATCEANPAFVAYRDCARSACPVAAPDAGTTVPAPEADAGTGLQPRPGTIPKGRGVPSDRGGCAVVPRNAASSAPRGLAALFLALVLRRARTRRLPGTRALRAVPSSGDRP